MYNVHYEYFLSHVQYMGLTQEIELYLFTCEPKVVLIKTSFIRTNTQNMGIEKTSTHVKAR